MTASPKSPAVRPGENREYRRISGISGLHAYGVCVEETDLQVHASASEPDRCREVVIEARGQLLAFIREYPGFLTAMAPWPLTVPAPRLIQSMVSASAAAGVGPMAAVAGAIAETVGYALLEGSKEVVVENGGDLFMALDREAVVGIYAGESPLSMAIGIRLNGPVGPMGICTSSASVGHSVSRGRADAACILSRSAAAADALATATANRIRHRGDIAAAVDWARSREGVEGIVAIKGDRMGAWGAVEVVSLKAKRG
jgi:hypothetical protein